MQEMVKVMGEKQCLHSALMVVKSVDVHTATGETKLQPCTQGLPHGTLL